MRLSLMHAKIRLGMSSSYKVVINQTLQMTFLSLRGGGTNIVPTVAENDYFKCEWNGLLIAHIVSNT